MKFKQIFLTCLLGCIWIGCKKDDVSVNPNPQPPAQQIIPGQGLTDIGIGDEVQKAVDKYGGIGTSSRLLNGQYYYSLDYLSSGVSLYCEPTTESIFNTQMKIKSIVVSAPFKGQTDKKIGIGSMKSEVKAAYGEPGSYSPSFKDQYGSLGITFVYTHPGELVERIELDAAKIKPEEINVEPDVTNIEAGNESGNTDTTWIVDPPVNLLDSIYGSHKNGKCCHYRWDANTGITTFDTTYNNVLKIERLDAFFIKATGCGTLSSQPWYLYEGSKDTVFTFSAIVTSYHYTMKIDLPNRTIETYLNFGGNIPLGWSKERHEGFWKF